MTQVIDTTQVLIMTQVIPRHETVGAVELTPRVLSDNIGRTAQQPHLTFHQSRELFSHAWQAGEKVTRDLCFYEII